MKQRPFSLPLAITAVLAIGGGIAFGLGSVLYEDPSTMRSIPKKTAAGYLATADGGVVNVMSAPAPTAVGQVFRITTPGNNASGTWQNIPDGGASLSNAIPPVGTFGGAGWAGDAGTAMRGNAIAPLPALPAATTTGAGVVQFDTTLPSRLGVPAAGTSAKSLRSDAIFPAEGRPYTFYYPLGPGNVAPTTLSQIPTAADTFTATVTTNPSYIIDVMTVSGDPGDASLVAGGVQLFRLMAYATAPVVVDVYTFLGAFALYNQHGTATVLAGSDTTEYDIYQNATHDLVVGLPATTPLRLWVSAHAVSGTANITIGMGVPTYRNGQWRQGTRLSMPWTPRPSLASNAPPLVAAGPSVAGTATSARRSDDVVGLSATNPNKGDFYRSPTGTDTATNTDKGWNHGLDLVRYAGSGTADPTTGAGVPCLLASASPLSMCLYYQTVHCNDAGCTYAIWWKSGSSDTQWTEFGTGGGGGGGAIALTSPLGTINIGSGGGLTTEDVVFGHAVHTALQGSEWNAASGVCPLDPNTMVPLANLYPSTESHAGTLSAADKIILDNMVSDTYEVKAAAGTTPGYLASVCESTDSSITIGRVDNYVTFAANFGTGASQVCSGATCAGLQSQLPACAPGKIEQFGTVTQTGTDTTTTTTRSCQSLPSYVSPPPVSTVHNIATSTSSSTLTALATAVLGDNAVVVIPVASTTAPGIAQRATDGRIAAASGTAASTATSVLAADVKVARSTNRNISTTTATATASSTATDVLGSDAQVVLPVANASTQGISKVASNAAIASSTNTGTASSTAGATCMPADATANGDHKVSVTAGSVPFYLADAIGEMSTVPIVGGYPIALGVYDDGGGYKYLQIGARAGSSSVSGMVQLDPNAPPALDGGPATIGSRGLAADSGNKPKLGGNSPTPRQALIGGACTSTSTGTATGTAINFCSLQETDIASLPGDLTARPTYSSFTTGCLPKAGSASSLVCSSSSDDGHGIVNGGTSGLSTLRHLLNLGAEGYGEPGAVGVDSNGDKIVLWRGTLGVDYSIGVGTAGDMWFKSPTSYDYYCGNPIAKCASISATGITAPNLVNRVQVVHSADVTGGAASPSNGSWVSIADLSTTAAVGCIVAQASISIGPNNAGLCYARLVLDTTPFGVVAQTYWPSYQATAMASLSTVGYQCFAAGGHSVHLQIQSTPGVVCTVPGGGTYASLVTTEFSSP